MLKVPKHNKNQTQILDVTKLNLGQILKALILPQNQTIEGITIKNHKKLIIDTNTSKGFKVVACQAYNQAGYDRQIAQVNMLNALKIKVNSGISMPVPVVQRFVQPLNITCQFSVPSKNIAIFGWYKNGFLLPKARSHILYIKKPDFADAGVYTCVASRSELPDNIKADSINIQVLPEPLLEITGLETNAIEVRSDKKLNHIKYVEIDSGNDLRYTCQANDNPNAIVDWSREYLPGVDIAQQEEVITYEKIGNDTLAHIEIMDLHENDSGRFECIGVGVCKFFEKTLKTPKKHLKIT